MMNHFQRTLALFILALVPVYAFADTDVEVKANIIAASCEISLNNNQNIDLGTVTTSYFASNITPEDDYPGGKKFDITVKNCNGIEGKTPTQLTLSFTPVSGKLSTYSNQIFANENLSGAQNVGVVIFSAQDPANPFNVLKTDGTPKSIFPVTNQDLINKNYTFYTRLQKESDAASVTAGAVNVSVWVSAYYE